MLQSNMLAKASLQRDAGNTLADIRNANKTPMHQRGIDLLLLATPPPDIAALSWNAPTSAADCSAPEYIRKLVIAARPRYILWGARDNEGVNGQSAYWEREPFGWDSTGKLREDRFTRAVKLDTFGGPKGARKVRQASIMYKASFDIISSVRIRIQSARAESRRSASCGTSECNGQSFSAWQPGSETAGTRWTEYRVSEVRSQETEERHVHLVSPLEQDTDDLHLSQVHHRTRTSAKSVIRPG